MKNVGEKDFLTVLHSLETILKAQTKSSKKIIHDSPKKRKKSKPKFSEEYDTKQQINDNNDTTVKESNSIQITSTPKEFTSNESNSISKSENQLYEQKSNETLNSTFSINENKTNKKYSIDELNILFIFFLRWMKKCSQKIREEGKNKTKITTERTNDLSSPLQNANLAKSLSASISIERVNFDSDKNKKIEKNNAKSKEYKINFTSFPEKNDLNHSLTPQQEIQYLDFFQPGFKCSKSINNSNNNLINQVSNESDKMSKSDLE